MPFKELIAIQNQGEGAPEKLRPKKPWENLAPELLPYKEELEDYLKAHLADFSSFLEYRNAPYKLVCGDGFYHAPLDNIVCLSVPEYKECKEGGMTINQFLFGPFHEFAHLKQMVEEDRAGRRNRIAQMTQYEAKKAIRDGANPRKFASLKPTYRQYYNIMEDAIVNHLVLKTRHYSQYTNPKSHNEVKELYTDKLFALYKKQSGADYAEDESAPSGFRFVGSGKGDFAIVSQADYEAGFDWREVYPSLKRSSQFLTFFIKNQMTGISPDDIGTDGKFRLEADAETALTKPLVEAYPELLKNILDKYRNDPRQKKRYLEFMGSVISAPEYHEKDGKPVKGVPVLTENVFVRPKRMVGGKETDIYVEKNYDLDEAELESLLNNARFQFSRKLEAIAKALDLPNYRKLTYLDLFNSFKITKKARGWSLTDPLKLNLQERTVVMRRILEPIFSMLCVLDDSFDVVLPDDNLPSGGGQGGEPKPKGPERNPEQSVFQKGQKVRNKDNNSPHFGKKGIIVEVNPDPAGGALSVVVEYFEENDRMAGGLDFSALSEEIFDPEKNLKIITKKGKKGEPGNKGEEKVEYEYEDDDEEDDDDDESDEDEESDEDDENQNTGEDGEDDAEEGGGDGDGESENEDENKEEGKPGKKEKEPKTGAEKKKEKLLAEMEKTLEFLRGQEDEDDRADNMKAYEEAKRSNKYQEKNRSRAEEDSLRQSLREARRKRREPEPAGDLSDEIITREYLRLEKEIAPYANEMAQAWLEVVKNISREIIIARDKYFPSGKPNWQKLQRYFPLLEAGKEMDGMQIYERWVEKVLVEIRPRMLRLSLLIDNSISMDKHVEKVRVMILLLNKSLASLSNLFELEMKKVLGASYDPAKMDFVCDSEIYSFGNKNNHRLLKDYAINDIRFLDDTNRRPPVISNDQMRINTLLAFQKLDCSEYTYDGSLWREVYTAHDQPEIKAAIAGAKLTEAIFQISDGDIKEGNIVIPIIDLLKKDFRIATGGLAIGGTEALTALRKRHGDRVLPADTATEAARGFKDFLLKVIGEQIEKPMIDFLKEDK